MHSYLIAPHMHPPRNGTSMVLAQAMPELVDICRRYVTPGNRRKQFRLSMAE